MSRRTILALVIALVAGLVATFPLRIAVGGMERQGLSARQVAGSIWYGRIGELTLRRQRLGTFEARILPLALLTGNTVLAFERIGDPDGELTGKLHVAGSRGVSEATGRIAAAGLFAPLPIRSIQLQDVDLLFVDGRCRRAGGRITAEIALPVPGIGGSFAGAPSCEGERVRFNFDGPSGWRMEAFVSSDGKYRAWLTATGLPLDLQPVLGGAGFRATPEGMTLSAEGRL